MFLRGGYCEDWGDRNLLRDCGNCAPGCAECDGPGILDCKVCSDAAITPFDDDMDGYGYCKPPEPFFRPVASWLSRTCPMMLPSPYPQEAQERQDGTMYDPIMSPSPHPQYEDYLEPHAILVHHDYGFGPHRLEELHVRISDMDIMLANLQCEGTEASLSSCPRSPWFEHNCVWGEAVVLECVDSEPDPSPADILDEEPEPPPPLSPPSPPPPAPPPVLKVPAITIRFAVQHLKLSYECPEVHDPGLGLAVPARGGVRGISAKGASRVDGDHPQRIHIHYRNHQAAGDWCGPRGAIARV